MNGQCLCGAISFTCKDDSEIGACHCGMCRRWGGGPFFGVHCGPDVEFKGAEGIAVYPSSDWAERAFCKHCGTHLYYKLLTTGDYFMPAGAFDSTDFEIKTQLYIDKKPPYYALANKTATLTEQEVIDKYGPPSAAP